MIGDKSIKNFPWISKDNIGIPNAIARSSLFTVEKLDSSHLPVRGLVVYAQGSIKISYTGIPLTQFDLNVWLHLVKIASELQNFSFEISERELLIRLKITFGGTQSEHLREVIHKIASGLIAINDDFKSAHFINSYGRNPVSKKWEFTLNPDTASLFDPGSWSTVNWLIRDEVRSSSLASWLHAYCSTHKSPVFPIGIDKLRLMSGSKCSTKEFKRVLGNAATKIEVAAKKHDNEFYFKIENGIFSAAHGFQNKKKKTK